MRSITLGQYYPVESPIHKLDPRVKLAVTLLYVFSLFFAKGPVGYLIAAFFLALYICVSNVPFSFIVRGLKPIIFLLIFSVIFNVLLTPGEVLARFWIFRITKEGLSLAFYMGIRLIFLIIGSSMMTYTTTPNQLTDGLEKSLGFLQKVHFPIHEISMMMSIALRFIPILVEETDKIMKAQMARGADFEEGNLIQRAKNLIPLLVPLFISAFRRATDLAMAMEARCYHGGEGRTKMKPLHYERRDFVAYGAAACYLGLIIVARVLL